MLYSFAQNLEDVVLWRVLGHVEGGTYVDVGAADPETDSVTKVFYDRGWSGLNIEPVAFLAERLRDARERDLTVQACAGARSGEVTLFQVAGTGLSTADRQAAELLCAGNRAIEEVVVPLKRLDDLLSEADFDERQIHFLKIDVEGYEAEVLEGIDLREWRPWVVVVESTVPQSTEPNHSRWDASITEQGYDFCLFDGLNRFYVAREHSELIPLLSYPACVFDQPFVTAPHGEVLREYDQLLESSDRLEATIRDSLAAYERLQFEHQTTLDGYERLSAEHQSALDGYGRLSAEHQSALDGYERSQREILSLHRESEVLHASTSRVEAECATFRAGVAQMASEMDGLRTTVADIEANLDAIWRSTSWSVTKPIRSFVDHLKSVRNRYHG